MFYNNIPEQNALIIYFFSQVRPWGDILYWGAPYLVLSCL